MVVMVGPAPGWAPVLRRVLPADIGSGWAGRRPVALGAVAAGIAADWLLGEPPAAWHPVAGFGRAMAGLEHRCYADSRRRGAAFAAVGAGSAALAGWLLDRGAASWPLKRAAGSGGSGAGATLRRGAGAGLATYVAVAGRALAAAAADVAQALDSGDLEAARARLPALVGRDPAGLDEPEIVRAVVESVAENTVDAVVAAAVWAALGGAPAVLAYRAVNTLDAMVGHLSPRYTRFGWASARADDLAGWVPARLTAVLVAALRPAAAGQVWTAVRNQAGRHPSPNAGVVEAAFAAALGVRVGGANVYAGRQELRPQLGTGRAPAAGDIARAVRLSRQVAAAVAVLGLAGSRGWWRR
jgi:adenosylcobinamide-phosphate synthase